MLSSSRALLRRLRRRDEHRSRAVEGREQPLKSRNLGQIIYRNICLSRVERQVVLVISLRRVELLARFDCRNNWRGKYLRLIELCGIRLGDASLLRGLREDG